MDFLKRKDQRRYHITLRLSKTSSISRDTRKESQNSSVTKINSIGFNHDAKLLCKTSNNKYDWTPIKYLNVLHHNRTQKQLRQYFLNILQKYYQLPILGTLGTRLTTSIKKDNANL